jgi:hypothetical protein
LCRTNRDLSAQFAGDDFYAIRDAICLKILSENKRRNRSPENRKTGAAAGSSSL